MLLKIYQAWKLQVFVQFKNLKLNYFKIILYIFNYFLKNNKLIINIIKKNKYNLYFIIIFE